MLLREVIILKEGIASATFYHGTSREFKPGQWIKPPDEHGMAISEKGRKKNLDRVFFTQDLGSAKIYAGRAKNSLGGEAQVYIIDPYGDIIDIVTTRGTTVFSAPKARVLKKLHI